MGVSRIRVNIDRLVLNGFEQLEGKALAEALQSHLSQVTRGCVVAQGLGAFASHAVAEAGTHASGGGHERAQAVSVSKWRARLCEG